MKKMRNPQSKKLHYEKLAYLGGRKRKINNKIQAF